MRNVAAAVDIERIEGILEFIPVLLLSPLRGGGLLLQLPRRRRLIRRVRLPRVGGRGGPGLLLLPPLFDPLRPFCDSADDLLLFSSGGEK